MTWQKQEIFTLKTKTRLQSIPAQSDVMNLIGVDICNLP